MIALSNYKAQCFEKSQSVMLASLAEALTMICCALAFSVTDDGDRRCGLMLSLPSLLRRQPSQTLIYGFATPDLPFPLSNVFEAVAFTGWFNLPCCHHCVSRHSEQANSKANDAIE